VLVNLAPIFARADPLRRSGSLFDPRGLRRETRKTSEARIRALAANAAVDERTTLCRALGRYKMFVDSRDRGLAPHLVLDGYWEMWVTEVMAQRVRPGMTVADVGANVGYFTLLMADLVGPKGAVHAFEPNPAMAALLRQNLALNGFEATVHPIALSDRDGALVRLVIPEGEPKNAYIVPCTPRAAEAEVDPLILETHRLDSVPGLGAVDVLKIDADTAEEAIWRGMTGLLQGGRPMTVILEFAPARYPDPRGFLAAIAAQGFSLALIDHIAGERAATVDDILAGSPTGDRMLLLCR
jgi:FkbM family methyltransferase